jgi:hypothetical protein
MPGPHPKGLVEAAAFAVATGQSAKKWAESNGISVRTLQRWAQKPAFRRRVEDLRRRLIDQSIGTLTVASTAAAVELAKLATNGTSEQIRLQASRAILSDMLAVSAFHDQERRIAAIEERLNARDREPSGED